MKINKNIWLLTLLTAALFSCMPDPTDPGDANEDTSPGVDEFFRVDIDGNHWEENDDEMIAAVLTNFGTGPKYGLTTTRSTDSSYYYYIIPYFYSNDTTWNLGTTTPGMTMTFFTDSIYNQTSSGSLHIIRTEVNSMEVFTGTFNYTGLEALNDSPANFSNGEFVIARLL